jgi:hypothetical protein
MKKTKIIYWTLTIIFAGLMLMASIPDILLVPDAIKFITALGYPVYFIQFIGIAKLLGVVAILIPGYPRIKEWAYAGLAYDLIGATYSQIAIGGSEGKWMFMFIWIFMLIGSYIYYHKKLSQSIAMT